MTNPDLVPGYSPVPRGSIVSAVTCLEMRNRPPRKPLKPTSAPISVVRVEHPEIESYRMLFRAVGENLMWFSRLVMPDETLKAILASADVEVYELHEGRRRIGLLELDFRETGQCELAYFGLVPDAVGRGYGGVLMDRALAYAWQRPIERLWVHTCTFDHPSALGFYIKFGFTPYAYMVECAPDPRLSGFLPRSAAPHIPIIE